MKAKIKMGEMNHIYLWYDGSSKQRGDFAETSGQRRPDEDMLREEESMPGEEIFSTSLHCKCVTCRGLHILA